MIPTRGTGRGNRDRRDRLHRFAERRLRPLKIPRTHRGIQHVEHAEDHGDGLFKAVCELGLEGIVSKRLDAPIPLGAVENVDQSQESESAGSGARRRRNFLTARVLWSGGSRCRDRSY